MKKSVVMLVIILVGLALLTCEFVPVQGLRHDNPVDPEYVGPDEKTITSFGIEGMVTVTIDEDAKTITVTVPAGTDVTALVPLIEYTGASIIPASGTQEDFSDPVTYTVTAWDETTSEYTVTVTFVPLPVLIYDAGDSSGGTVPAGSTEYQPDSTVTVLGNTGSLTGPVIRDGIRQVFIDWNTREDGTGTAYDAGDTFTITEDTDLYAMYTSDTEVLRKIGPAGGWVFYDQGSYSDGWRYLEAAPTDQSTTQPWSNVTDELVPGTWTVVGYGAGNTVNMVAQDASMEKAATVCASYSSGGYDDWFLPSSDELNLMYANLHNQATPVGGFTSAVYWSSSENSATTAHDLNFNDGNLYFADKGSTRRVRAARSFTGSSTDYALRDPGPAGGLIFYKADNGDGTWTYLEAAGEDQITSCTWSAVTNAWVILGENTGIGTGNHNTRYIIVQPGHLNSAAKICSDYTLNGYSDWFLPSSDELYWMYENLHNQPSPVGGFGDYYWSSSEKSQLNAWRRAFSDGNQAESGKQFAVFRTRAVRAF